VLWRRLLHEHATPREIGWAVGAGVLAGCTPIVGTHGIIAIAIATAFRLNKLWALLGSRTSNTLIFPWIVLAQVQLSHRIRTGAWLALTVDDVLGRWRGFLLDWLLGMIPVGAGLAVAFGTAAYVVSSLVVRIKARRRPAPPPPPSSESPA